MRFDFFRRPDHNDSAVIDEAAVQADAPELGGYVTYTLQLDAQKRVKGYRMGWRPARLGATDAATQFQQLLACISEHLNPEKPGWRLGATTLFLDVSVEALFMSELQSLPPQNVVLCMGLADILDVDTRSMLLFLRDQGFGLMLCDAETLPDDPDVLSILTHLDVGDGDPALLARLGRDMLPGLPPIQPIATRMPSWKKFDDCASRRVDVFVEGKEMPEVVKIGELQPESTLIVRLMQMIQANQDVRAIEAALKHDAALTYRLLHHINSPAIGAGVEVHSLRHAVAMLGYSPLFRWLSLLLATSNKESSPFMTKKAILRGRFVELMGQGMLAPSEADNLFVVGMFSLIDQLLGVPMKEVLTKVQLNESVQQAILTRSGSYGPFLALAEACELDGDEAARLSESLFMSASQVNAAHLAALAWAQDVGTSTMH